MNRLNIETRSKNWFLVLIGITFLGYFFSLNYAMLLGLGCLLFILVDFLADNLPDLR